MKWLARVLPAPLLSISMLLLWLVLNGSLSAGHWLIGLALAVLVPLATASLRPEPSRVRAPVVLMRLIVQVGRDVIVSNLDVARGECLVADGIEGQPRRQHQAFLRAGDGHVHAPLVVPVVGAGQARDGVHHQQRRVFGRVDGAAHGRDDGVRARQRPAEGVGIVDHDVVPALRHQHVALP